MGVLYGFFLTVEVLICFVCVRSPAPREMRDWRAVIHDFPGGEEEGLATGIILSVGDTCRVDRYLLYSLGRAACGKHI